MTRIRATCPDCGEVDLRPYDLRVRVVADDGGSVTSGSNYRFACPDCTRVVTKPADARVVELLRGGGVAVEVATRTASAGASDGHPEQPPGGPPLDLDDLIALHVLLSRDDWFDRLRDR